MRPHRKKKKNLYQTCLDNSVSELACCFHLQWYPAKKKIIPMHQLRQSRVFTEDRRRIVNPLQSGIDTDPVKKKMKHLSDIASLESVLPRCEQARAQKASPELGARQSALSVSNRSWLLRACVCVPRERFTLARSWYRPRDQRSKPVRLVLYFHAAYRRVVFYSLQTFLGRVSPERKARCSADREGGPLLSFPRAARAGRQQRLSQ